MKKLLPLLVLLAAALFSLAAFSPPALDRAAVAAQLRRQASTNDLSADLFTASGLAGPAQYFTGRASAYRDAALCIETTGLDPAAQP